MKQRPEIKASAPQPAALAPRRIDQFEPREVIDTIKQTVCRGATDAQLRLFMEVCRATGLNPFIKGEIWYVAEKGIIMAGRDGYLRVANEHPAFDGMETRVERDERGVPVKAVCTVWRKDRNHPTVSEAYYSEYKKASPVWQQYPSAMISKVAETLALKRSFAINGVVTEEEIGHDETAQEKPQSKPEAPARSSLFEEMINQFAELKARLAPDEAIYYEILGQFGVKHSNEFRDLGKARTAYRVLLEKVRKHEVAPQLAEESAIIDAAAMMEEIAPPDEEAIP
jgi:phage recombination protein Bet